MINPKETKIILELLDLKSGEVANAIGCDKGDLSAEINQRKRLPAVRERFAAYLSEQLRIKLLPDSEAAVVGPTAERLRRGPRLPLTTS